jgi:thioredoxin 1
MQNKGEFAMIRYINEDSFQKEVLGRKDLVLVDFYANWCGPCIKLGSELEDLSNSRAGYEIVKIDVDKSPNLVREYGIDVIPVIMLFKSGELIEKQVGYIDRQNIQNIMEKYL